MKNREKYPNIDDAMKAWRKHKDESGCPCSFETWLDNDPYSLDGKTGILTALVGMTFLHDLLSKEKDADAKPFEPPADKPNDDERGDIECPLCHGKHGKINEGVFFTEFVCPDCDARIANKVMVRYSSSFTMDEFKAWFSKFSAKKD